MKGRKRLTVYLARILVAIMVFSTVTVAPLTQARAADGESAETEAECVYASDFEEGDNGFSGRGATAERSEDAAHEGSWSLKVTGRDSNWKGASVDITDKVASGETYTASVWVKLLEGETSDATMKLSVAVKSGGTESYKQFAGAEGKATAGGDWIQLTGSLTMESWDSVVFYIETSDNATASFYVDDVTITKSAGSGEDEGGADEFEPSAEDIASFAPYFREDPGEGQQLIELAAPDINKNEYAETLDKRVPEDYAGGTVEVVDYPFADAEGKGQLLRINYVHNGESTFGGITVRFPLEEAVEVPEGSNLEFDVYYPKSSQGKFMRWRFTAEQYGDAYMRDYDYTSLNPDWLGNYEGETYLLNHHSTAFKPGETSAITFELHGENARPAETATLLVGNIRITTPDPDTEPLPLVVNVEKQSDVTPLKEKYNTDNGLFMVGAIGTGTPTDTRARHYEIFVDGNNLKPDGTHKVGPNWLVDVDGNPLEGADAEPGLGEYSFPTEKYQQIRDAEGDYAMHGHTLAWYNQAPSWMTQIIPEHLESGYTGTPEFYGLGNNVSNTVKVDKNLAKRVQFNHIMYVMRHFLTDSEQYGSSAERGIIPFHSWDVLNEEVHESRHSVTIAEDPTSWRSALKQTNWLVAMSDDDISGELTDHYIYLLFKFAHIAAPNAQMAAAYKANYDSLPEYMKLDGHDNDGSIDEYVMDNPPALTYNDYGTSTTSKALTIYNMVKELNTAWQSDPLYDGRPLIEVIGFQGHDSVSPTLASDNQYAMALYASLVDEGLLSSISFSEFDLKVLSDAPGGGATAPARLNVKQSDALGYQYALMYKLFSKFAPYIDHIMSWGVQGSGWGGSYVLFDENGRANAGYYAAMDPDRFIEGHSYLDEYFDGEYEKLAVDYAIDLGGDRGTFLPKSGETEEVIPSYTDAEGHWGAEAIAFAAGRKLIDGTSETEFSPDAPMTRGLLLTALARLEDVDTTGGETWYEKGVAWAVEAGVSDGSDPEGEITREQLATIMYLYAQWKETDTSAGDSLSAFEDAGEISEWAREGMNWAISAGLLGGTSNTSLDPDGTATRVQAAAVIMRYAENFIA